MSRSIVEIQETETTIGIIENSVDVDVIETTTTVVLGNSGPQGIAGVANNLEIGTVATGAAGTNASANITGTSPNQTLNLTIPRGDTGDSGISLTSGYFYAPDGASTQRSFSLNYLYYVPFIFPGATSISKLGILLISTALSNSVRLGIYDSNENNQPANLLAETTSIQTGTGQALGFKSADIEVSVQQGLYWLAFVNQGSVPSTFLGNNGRPYFIPQGTFANPVSTIATQYQHWNEANVTGTLPETATPILFDSSVQPRIYLGVS